MSKVKTYKPGFLESLHQAETSEKKAQLRLLVALDWLTTGDMQAALKQAVEKAV